ncbi:MAG: hypothetical protein J5I93_09995, partial [Pirellulaceae bacterium]|nr:hypothetical protein [Pirellulaceae bacterium]
WFVRRQLDLRRSVAEHQRDIRRRAYPSLAHKLGGLLEVVPPEIPAGWYRDVLYGGGAATEPEYVDRLPEDVAEAVRNYVAAKQTLHLLARGLDDQAS